MPISDAHEPPRAGRLSYLSEEDKQAIYEAALEIVGSIGMRVHHPEAVELLRAAGCGVGGDLVTIPRELVEKARASAPHVIEVFDRAGRPAMSLGGTNSYFGTGSDLMSTYDLETGEHRVERAVGRGPRRSPVRRAAQHRLRHVLRPPQRRRAAPLLSRELPRHGHQHDQADGHDGRERRRPRGLLEDRLRAARRPRGAARQAVLHHVPRAGEPAQPPGREHRQAAVLRRLGHPGDLLAGAAGGRHGADHASPGTPPRARPSRSSASSSTSCAGPARPSSSASARPCWTWRRRSPPTTRPSTS